MKKEFQRGSDQNVVAPQTSSNVIEMSNKIKTENLPFDVATWRPLVVLTTAFQWNWVGNQFVTG